MSRELNPIDISTMPDVARLADDVQRTRRPRLLRRGSADVAVLIPATEDRTASSNPRDNGTAHDRDAVLSELQRRRRRGLSITDQTAGILNGYAKSPAPTPREEKDAFEQAVVDEVVEHLGG